MAEPIEMRDAVLADDSGGTKEPCIRWGSDHPRRSGNS